MKAFGKPKNDPFAERAVRTKQFLAKQVVDFLLDKRDPLNRFLKSPKEKEKFLENDLWWHTADGKTMRASLMETQHMFYALRMVYNRSVPIEYRRSPKSGLKHFRSTESDSSIKILCKLLNQRLHDPTRETEFTDEMLTDLAYMQAVIRAIL